MAVLHRIESLIPDLEHKFEQRVEHVDQRLLIDLVEEPRGELTERVRFFVAPLLGPLPLERESFRAFLEDFELPDLDIPFAAQDIQQGGAEPGWKDEKFRFGSLTYNEPLPGLRQLAGLDTYQEFIDRMDQAVQKHGPTPRLSGRRKIYVLAFPDPVYSRLLYAYQSALKDGRPADPTLDSLTTGITREQFAQLSMDAWNPLARRVMGGGYINGVDGAEVRTMIAAALF